MSFHWQEIIVTNLDAPHWSIAGRHSGPPESRGDAVGALVQAGAEALNSMSVNHAIEREKRRLNQVAVPNYFQGHRTGGILAVGCIGTRRVGEINSQAFIFLSLFPGGIFAEPRHAISVWRQSSWRRQVLLPGGYASFSYRFFWVTRSGV